MNKKVDMHIKNKKTIFEMASQVFDGWTDPETGMRVLRLHSRGKNKQEPAWSTLYHQSTCFLERGRKVLLRGQFINANGIKRHVCFLDLTTGEINNTFPPNYGIAEVRDGTFLAALSDHTNHKSRAIIWDMKAQKELASLSMEGWAGPALCFLSDNRRAIAMYFRRKTGEVVTFGSLQKTKYYEKVMISRHYLLTPGEEPQLIFEETGYFCNHIQGCPADHNIYSYDRWPTPKRYVEQVIHIHSLDGKIDKPIPLSPEALRPGDMFGVRDHYIWTPDGKRIISYLTPKPIVPNCDHPSFNHFKIEWWLSALDWRTGEDYCAKYPPGRWGGHMQVTPDSKYIVCGGGPDFQKLYAVNIEKLCNGWNENIICAMPKYISQGNNADPFPYPFVLPDGSGVIFNAGWPGPEHGVYLAEWPEYLK